MAVPPDGFLDRHRLGGQQFGHARQPPSRPDAKHVAQSMLMAGGSAIVMAKASLGYTLLFFLIFLILEFYL